MSNVLPLPVSFSLHVWMSQEHHQVTGDASQLSPLSLNLPSLSSTVFHISDKTSKANHCPVKRWMGVRMLSCIWCDQTTDERDEMLRVGDTAEVPCRLPNSFPPLPPPIILHWDSLPPVIDMLLKYSSRPVTLAFPLWAQMDPLWERSLVWICEYVCSGGSSWDRKLYIVIILCYFILFIHYVSELDIVIFSVQNVLERYTYRFI